MKTFRSVLAAGVAAILAACGGGDGGGPAPITYQYQGTVSGANCFTGAPESQQVIYRITFESAPAAGTPVVLRDATTTWNGVFSAPTSFRVTMGTDSRLSIAVTDATAASAQVDSTASCVSFRCCTTLSGKLLGSIV